MKSIRQIGVFGSSRKENEFRLPIHPGHLRRLPEDIRKKMYFETGYGLRYGYSDAEISQSSAGMLSRDLLFETCDFLVIPKPVVEDLEQAAPGSTITGWMHCVQQPEMAQAAIDRRLSLIAWESMYAHSSCGRPVHIFHRNNEIAGYCAVLHAFQQLGLSGRYGPQKKVVVISLGSVSRGAITALEAIGLRQITVFTQRKPELIADKIVDCEYGQIKRTKNGIVGVLSDETEMPFGEILKQSDVIINGILQDVDDPLMYVSEEESKEFKRNTLVVDISCDMGMGFPFAVPTTFESPILKFNNVDYYAVDHTPSYHWNSATWEISLAFIPWFRAMVDGNEAWQRQRTLKDALEIYEGIVLNPKILSFQKRALEYPHNIL